MLDLDEQDRIAEQFGVDRAQVLRDHLISHVLAALSVEAPDAILFFGGTALARSILTTGRLSEDVDLIAVGSRLNVAEQLTTAIPRALRREFPGPTWSPTLTQGRDSDAPPATLTVPTPAGFVAAKTAAFTHPPDEAQWRRDLAAQVRLTVTAAEAGETVRARWADVARDA